jgi:hypothetical protein
MADTPVSVAGHDSSRPGRAGPEIGHEERDVNIRAVLGFGAGLLVAAGLIQLMVWLLFAYFSGREALRVAPEYPLAVDQGTRVPPEPRLQTNPRQDLRLLRAHEEGILNSYGWVDRTAGVVRIPIDQAIKLTSQRGLPVRHGSGETKK